MVLKGSVTRSSSHAGRLATHLLNEKDNERVEVLEIRGQNTDDPRKALLLMHGAVVLTKGKNGLFQVSINPEKGQAMNPDQWKDALSRVEKEFGLEGQARVVIGHLKEGREHIHSVWQRTDYETEKVIPVKDFKDRLRPLGREMEREYGHREINDKAASHQFDQAAFRQSKRNNDLDPRDRSALIKGAWERSESPDQFRAILKDAGYELAEGNRARVVLLDASNGEIIKGSLGRHLKGPDRSGPKVAEIREWAKGLSQPLLTVEAMKKEFEASQHFDRDRHAAIEQDKTDRAGIEHDRKTGQGEEKEGGEEGEASSGGRQPAYDDSHLRKLDEQQAQERREDRTRARNEAEGEAFYKRQDQIADLAKKKAELAKNQGIRGQVTGRRGELEREIEALTQTLENTDQRISERHGAVEARISKERTDKEAQGPAPANENAPHPESEDDFTRRMRERNAERGRSREQSRDEGLGL